MKKVLVLALAALALPAHAVNLNQLAQEGICQSNAASFYPECKKAAQSTTERHSCVMEVEERKGARVKRYTQSVRLDVSDRTIQGYNHIYHEEDNNGSTTITFDSRTGKGVYSVMDANEVIQSGNVYSCR